MVALERYLIFDVIQTDGALLFHCRHFSWCILFLFGKNGRAADCCIGFVGSAACGYGISLAAGVRVRRSPVGIFVLRSGPGLVLGLCGASTRLVSVALSGSVMGARGVVSVL